MSELVDALNPAHEFDLGDGKTIRYRKINYFALGEALRQGVREEKPDISDEELDKRVEEGMDQGSGFSPAAMKHIVLAGLKRDNPSVTLDEIADLFVLSSMEIAAGLALAIIGTERRKPEEKSAGQSGEVQAEKKTT